MTEFEEEHEEGVSEEITSEQDVYDKDGVEGAMSDDGISPEEEGFMQGYNDDDEEKKKKEE